jgi:glycine betaine catabolism A
VDTIALAQIFMTAFRKATVQRGAFTLAGHYYTSAATFQREIQRIFYNHWLCVGRSEQILESGDYFLAQIAEDSLIVLRDPEGVARAFFNVCRHRGTRLCTASQGHFVETIQCPYHAWTYSLQGELRSTRPLQQAGFAANDYPLYACALHEWEGLLWINLAPNPAPFTQTFAPLLSRFSPWQLATRQLGHRVDYEVSANWKLIFQNYSESYHASSEHSRLTPYALPSDRPDLRTGAFLGKCLNVNRQANHLSPTYQPARPPLVTQDENRQQVYYYSLFPTMLLSLHSDYVVTHRLYPLGAGRTQVVCEWLFSPEAIAQADFDPSDAIEQWEATNRRNWQVCELTQQGIGHAHTSGSCTHRDGLLVAFNQEYLRVMGA